MKERMITRTMKSYIYTFGSVNLATGTIENRQKVTTMYKMKRDELKKHTSNGNILFGMQEHEDLYGITLSDFFENAVEVESPAEAAKKRMISRSINVYHYVFCTFNPIERAIVRLFDLRILNKLERKRRMEMEKEGLMLVHSSEETDLYGITYELFMKHAVLLNPEDRKAMEGIEVVK